MVLDIPGNCEKDTNVINWNKHGGDNQLFYFDPNGTIMSRKFQMALAVKSCGNGEYLIILTQNVSHNQVFETRKDGIIYNQACDTVIDMVNCGTLYACGHPTMARIKMGSGCSQR